MSRKVGNVDAIRKAANALLDQVFYVDNGYCSICHGYWKEHGEECLGVRLKTALAARPADDDDDAGLGPTGKPRCPKCGNSFQNGTPADAPGFQRCATCKHVWQPYPSAPAADDAGRAVTEEWALSVPEFDCTKHDWGIWFREIGLEWYRGSGNWALGQRPIWHEVDVTRGHIRRLYDALMPAPPTAAGDAKCPKCGGAGWWEDATVDGPQDCDCVKPAK